MNTWPAILTAVWQLQALQDVNIVVAFCRGPSCCPVECSELEGGFESYRHASHVTCDQISVSERLTPVEKVRAM